MKRAIQSCEGALENSRIEPVRGSSKANLKKPSLMIYVAIYRLIIDFISFVYGGILRPAE